MIYPGKIIKARITARIATTSRLNALKIAKEERARQTLAPVNQLIVMKAHLLNG